jgi:hypothetical protein
LGLVSAVLEIMVDEDGRYVFTEVNQGGQFLWVTEHFPDSPILDAFADFLIERDPAFVYDGQGELTVSRVRETEAYRELRTKERAGLYPPPAWTL